MKQLRETFPDKMIVYDVKVVDFGAEEVELAAKAGADIVSLWGSARKSTILTAIRKARVLGIKVMVDIGEDEPLERAKERAKELEAMGADYVVYLIPKDEQAVGKKISPPTISALSKILTIPLAVAGGLNAQSAPKAIEAGAKICIIGEAIYKSEDRKRTAQKIKEKIGRIGIIRQPARLKTTEIIIETIMFLAKHISHVAHTLSEENTRHFLKVLASGHRVIIAGAGRSRIVGKFSKNWLSKLGLDVRVIEIGDEDIPPDFSYKLGDILIPISASGKTPAIVEYCATLRKKGQGIVKVLPITARADGPAWDKDDILITLSDRTKADWVKEKEDKIGKRVPLGTLSEFATLVFLLAITQAMLEEKCTFERVRDVMLRIERELQGAFPLIERQGDSFERVVEAILNTKWRGSRIVLDGFGRLERINNMFASRLIQIYGLNPLILREDVTAKIRSLDSVTVCSLSGEIEQVYKTINHCLKERGIVPIYFTGIGESPAHQFITKDRWPAKENPH